MTITLNLLNVALWFFGYGILCLIVGLVLAAISEKQDEREKERRRKRENPTPGTNGT